MPQSELLTLKVAYTIYLSAATGHPRTRRPGALGSACEEEDRQRHKEGELMGQATEMRLEVVRFDSDSVVLAYC